MKIFSNLFSVLFFTAAVAHGYGNLTFRIPSIVEILQAEPSTEISETCKKHLEDYLEGIQSYKFWALRMVDSITKFPDGILMGRTYFPGHFDECVNVVTDKFQGKHCMVQASMKKKSQDFFIPKTTPDDLAQLIQAFHYGICIPSTCSAEDIKNAIKGVSELDFLDVNLNETNCSTKEYRSFRNEDWVAVSVVIIILVIALLSTVFDYYQRSVKKVENPSQLWTSFSIYTNGLQLFKISQSTAQLKCLHGIRFLSMCWVILGHSYFSFLFSMAMNVFEIPKFLPAKLVGETTAVQITSLMTQGFAYNVMMGDKSFSPVSNAFVSVDSFFFLSGLLVCLVFFRDIAKKGSYDVPVAFLHRYIRLTPPFAILLLIQATLISRIGNGPFWNVATDKVENDCRESWWAGILYIQNYINPMAMCLGQTWYLSADMQMYWISPLVLYPLLWFPSLAPFFLGLLVLTAAFTNFAVAFVNKLQPNLLFFLHRMNWGPVTEKQFTLEYAPFHTRMAPWLVGLATGYIICGIQANKIKIRMSKIWAVCGWLATFGILGGTIFGIVRFIPDQNSLESVVDYTTVEAAFYLSFHRVGWALGLAWVVIACISGYGGPINRFLSMDFFQPLAKLSYCNFLIHMTLQNYRINSSRVNQYIRHFEVVYIYFGDLIISHLIAIPIVLLFEFPFTNLDRHFLQKLVIFPLPKVKLPEKEKEIEKPEKSEDFTEDVEKGKTNLAFKET